MRLRIVCGAYGIRFERVEMLRYSSVQTWLGIGAPPARVAV
jgi:hypothetical protein